MWAYNYKVTSLKILEIAFLNQLFNVAARCTTVARETRTLTSTVVADTTTTAVHSGHCTETGVHFAIVEVVVFIPRCHFVETSFHFAFGCHCENRWVCRWVGIDFGCKFAFLTTDANNGFTFCFICYILGSIARIRCFLHWRCGMSVGRHPTGTSSCSKLLNLEVFNSCGILLCRALVVQRIIGRRTLDQGAICSSVPLIAQAAVQVVGIPCRVVSHQVVCLEQLSRPVCLKQLVRLGDSKVVREVPVRATSAMSGTVVWTCCTLARVPCESWEAFAKSSCTIAETLVRAFHFCFVRASVVLSGFLISVLGPRSGTGTSATRAVRASPFGESFA